MNLHADPIHIMSVGGEQVLCVVHCRLELKQKLYILATQMLYRQDLVSKLSTQSFIYCHQLTWAHEELRREKHLQVDCCNLSILFNFPLIFVSYCMYKKSFSTS